MEESQNVTPFKTLGNHLKYLRQHSEESLAEVSGAVEINEDTLERIEQGVERPSEDILMLLISHFNMLDNEAVQLWELAGYDHRNSPEILNGNTVEELASGKPVVMLLAIDTRTQYSDGFELTVNDAGIVMSFTQAGGQNQSQVVARVGMSHHQAEQVSNLLQQAMLRHRYMRRPGLPGPKNPGSRRSEPSDSKKPDTKDKKSDNK